MDASPNAGQEELLRELTDRFLAGCDEIGTIHRLGRSPLPSADAVVEIARDLQELLFPGYRQREAPRRDDVARHVAESIGRLLAKLCEQFRRALTHDEELSAASRDDIASSISADSDLADRARHQAVRFLEQLPGIRAVLASDVRMAFDGDPAARSHDEIVCCYPGFEAVTIHRVAHAMQRLGVPLVPRMLAEWAHGRTGIDIHPGATIGPSFFIDHGTGVVIGETCEIAARVKLYQGVTLGAISFEKDAQGNIIRGRKRHPTIHEGVVIYANATVLGGKTVVGRNSVIGAGVALNRSVPPNTIVTLEKPQLRFREAA
ncbi:MAG: serine acetyltransferase [Planctomycetaceae bacterium]